MRPQRCGLSRSRNIDDRAAVVERVADSSLQEEVIQAVQKVCYLVPSSLTAQCKDLIETYGEAIIELLVQEVDPKTVCTMLALCNDASRAYVGKKSCQDTSVNTLGGP